MGSSWSPTVATGAGAPKDISLFGVGLLQTGSPLLRTTEMQLLVRKSPKNKILSQIVIEGPENRLLNAL